MAAYPKDIFEAALELPVDTRAALAEDLLDTVDEPHEVAQAWDREIERRLDRMDHGEGQAVPWAEARKRVFARLTEE